MKIIKSTEALDALYDVVSPLAIAKVSPVLTQHYRTWINAARFVVLSTVGPDGTDASPRGDHGSVVRIVDDHTLWMPDWRGNNRLDSLRNIVVDGRVSLMFMVPGEDNVVRVNGTAVVSDDTALTEAFAQDDRRPRTVIVIRSREVYFQCAKALMRSKLWTAEGVPGLPTAGQLLKERQKEFDDESYDAGYADHAKDRMW